MADNITLNAGSGGATIATDDDGTAHHQYVKLEFGGDGTFTKVTSSSGLPVTGVGGSLTVDGTVSVTGVATAAKQPALGTAGSASADVITVQGIASMTPLAASQSGTWTVQPGNTATGTSTTPSVIVSSAADQIVVDGLTIVHSGTLSVGASQTQRWNIIGGNGFLKSGGSTETGAASSTMSWSNSTSQDWALAAVPIKPVSTAITSHLGTLLGIGG